MEGVLDGVAEGEEDKEGVGDLVGEAEEDEEGETEGEGEIVGTITITMVEQVSEFFEESETVITTGKDPAEMKVV